MAVKGFASKIMVKIGILSMTQIIFIIVIFGILVYFQSQQTHLGNTINIAGKNRFLTLDMLYKTSEYLTQPTTTNQNNIDKFQIETAMQQLDLNIMMLRNGGKTSDIELKPLPLEFMADWNAVHSKWNSLKSAFNDRLFANALNSQSNDKIHPNPGINITYGNSLKQELATMSYGLVDSSDVLVTKLGQAVKNNLDGILMLQVIFALLNAVLIVFVLFLVGRILKPVSLLTKATSEIKKGNLLVSVKYKGNDELSVLAESFNSMVVTMKNYFKKQLDLTNELMSLNAKLQYADKAKDEFINVAAHEFRNPIQCIVNSISLLTNKTKDGEQRAFLDIAIRNSRRLQILIQNLLDVSKIENHSLNLNKEEFYLKELALNITREYEANTFGLNHFSFVLNSPEDDILIYADKVRICQVISNLIDNSIKFNSKGGIVSITIERIRKGNVFGDIMKWDSAVVHVRDSGEGINPEIFPKLFTKFATKSFQGTGLGLYICKNIIEAHGGKVWAQNNGDGGGSTFSFSLPIET
jgi:signal transduction histidine kinase